MSHDRGCPCGLERSEYDACPDEKCFKKNKCDVVFDFHSPHNNEYWYKCNTCGATDWFAYYHRDKVKRDEPLKDCKMKDTDWRPSPCPACGEMREAARNPVCRNPDCSEDVAKRNLRTMKTEPKRYVWIRANGDATIIDTDIVELWQGPNFDREKDRIYELGPEVEIEVTVNVKNKTVYRDNASGYRTPFENRD